MHDFQTQGAVGERVTLQLEGGNAVRVRLAAPPPGCAASLALATLRDALTPAAFHAIASLLADGALGDFALVKHVSDSL